MAKPETVSLADGAGRSGGFAEHCHAPAQPVGYAEPTVEWTAADTAGVRFEPDQDHAAHVWQQTNTAGGGRLK